MPEPSGGVLKLVSPSIRRYPNGSTAPSSWTQRWRWRLAWFAASIPRKTLAEGADIVVFAEASVGPSPISTRFDLPGGAARMYADAVGIHTVMVNGKLIADAASSPTLARAASYDPGLTLAPRR